MGNIVLLDELTINKIAAGEVVDRPASIVKELVENSIDAKATNITVEVKNGGVTFLKIIDNGTGIKSDDVEMAFERHATSKIRKEEDLATVLSMGFRGEALASVAAISNVELLTKSKDENVGIKVIVEAGRILSSELAPSTTGTTITIRNVFFNVPARFKFLKKDFTEAGYIEDVMTRLAIIYPSISFKYINNGKTIIQTSGNGDLQSVCYSIFGKDVSSNLINVDFKDDGISVSGVIGNTKLSRGTRNNQFFYVNSRYVKDKTLAASVAQAYNQMLAIGKFAFCILNLKISPALVDVNVHPAKLEVKFSDENLVFKVMYSAVKNALESHNKEVSPFTILDEKETIKDKTLSQSFKFATPESNTQKYDNINVFAHRENNILMNKIKYEEKLKENKENKDIEIIEVEDIKKESYDVNVDNVDKPIENIEEKEVKIDIEEKVFCPYKFIGTVFNTYIIIQIEDKMYIIDQHAAHERLIYERIKQTYYSKDKQTQMLLFPLLIDLTNKEKDLYKENEEYFKNIGFLTETFGENSVKISGVPDINYDIDYKEMFMDTIDEIMGATKLTKEEKENRFLYTVACKAAVKANMKLNEKECISLIEDMMCLESPFTCPHGRPTAYVITQYDIERKFLRK